MQTGKMLAGKVAVVTGASRGIGLGIAQHFHAHGARVLLCARRADAVEAAARAISDDLDTALGVAAHAADEHAARRCFDLARERWGRVDILINNAAVNPHFGLTSTVDRGRWDKILDVNLWAPLRWTQLALGAGLGVDGGTVLNVSSTLARSPGGPSGVYGMSKLALEYLTAQLAAELGPAVRVNAIAPGVVDTDFAAPLVEHAEKVFGGWPVPRFGLPADIAAAALFLVSDQSAWVTGQVLTVDGGAGIASDDFAGLASGPALPVEVAR